VRIVSAQGDRMAPADFQVRAGALDLNLSRLVARTDSFSVLVQGNALGFQRATLEKTAGGFRLVESLQIATFVQSNSEITMDARGMPMRVKQTGAIQGQKTNIDVSFANGRARGTALMPGKQPAGTPLAIDTVIPAGTIEQSTLNALLPAFRWAPDAKFTFASFNSDDGTLRQSVLRVMGKETVTVPAGTFEVYRADLTGGAQTQTLYVSTAAPNRLIKLTIAGQPVEIVLVK